MRAMLGVFTVLASAAVLTGCSGVVMLNPAHTPETVFEDAGLAGTWKLDSDDIYVVLAREADAWRVEVYGEKDDGKATEERYFFSGHLFRLDKQVYLDAVMTGSHAGTLKEVMGDTDGLVLATHYVARVERDGDTLVLYTLDGAWVAEQAAAGKVPLTVVPVPEKDKWWLVTDGTDKVQDFLRSVAETPEAWGPAKLVRQAPPKE